MRAALLFLPILLSIGLTPHGSGASLAAGVQVQSQGTYMARTLKAYASAYWARVAGRDAGLASHTNGHDEFAARWTKDMLNALAGLGAGVIHQPFQAPGFKDLPATRPGMNVIVVVPGTQHPERAVLVGTHYDGEPFSRGSAYDDASGCIIILGLARALGAIWRAHGPPSITVEFVLFDAEEQGLVGSLYNTSASARSIMPSTDVMINEEQSGVGYPVRPFGLASLVPLPILVSTSELMPKSFGTPAPMPAASSRRLDSRLSAALAGAFSQLHAVYPSIAYRGGSRPVFTAADRQLIRTGVSDECCSDNDPFQLHGIPNVTFSGNYDFYRSDAKPWSYPFDQPWDTFSALACDTGGSPRPSRALEAALDLPMMASALLVQRYAPSAPGNGLAAFSTPAQEGHAVHFTAIEGARARWDFGDGSWSTGRSPVHTYRHAGTYRVHLSGGGVDRIWTLHVASGPLQPEMPVGVLWPPKVRPWQPEQLRGVSGCQFGTR